MNKTFEWSIRAFKMFQTILGYGIVVIVAVGLHLCHGHPQTPTNNKDSLHSRVRRIVGGRNPDNFGKHLVSYILGS